MEVVDVLQKCKLCQVIMKDPRILPCQHSFCYACLKDWANKVTDRNLKCPTCLNEFVLSVEDWESNKFLDIFINLKTCGVCKEKDADDFCEKCNQSFCLNCGECHNNMNISKNHRFIRLGDGEHKKDTEFNLFCSEIDDFLELTKINSHEKHKFKTKEFGIKKRLLKWKVEVKNITDCRSEYMKDLGIDEEKWSVKKAEILEIKTELENNYQEFIEFLQNKQKLECDKIEAEIDKIEEKVIIYKDQINNYKITLKENETPITKKRKLVNRDSEEVTNDELPLLHPPPDLQDYRPFSPPPTDALTNFMAPIESIEMEVIKSAKGGRKLLLEGYAFNVIRQVNNVTYWRCEKGIQCRGTLVMKNGHVTKKTGHTHPPNPDQNTSLKAVASRKDKRAMTTVKNLLGRDSEEITNVELPPLHPPRIHSSFTPSIKLIEIEIIKTAKGGRKMLLDGYAFTVTRLGGADVTYWRCEKRNCKGTLVTNKGQVTRMTEHNHPPDLFRNIGLKAVSKMRLEAQISSDITGSIVKNNLSFLPLEVVNSLPSYAALTQKVRKIRRI